MYVSNRQSLYLECLSEQSSCLCSGFVCLITSVLPHMAGMQWNHLDGEPRMPVVIGHIELRLISI